MDIVFPCDHCGKKLVGDEAATGEIVACPACGQPTVIPAPVDAQPHAISAKHPTTAARRVVHVPKAAPKDASSAPPAGTPPAAHVPAPTPPSPRREEPHYIEIVVGWICVVVGTLLAVLLPRAPLVYVPFFMGALIMAILLFACGRVAHGVVLLLCTCIPPPLLMRQNIWRNVPASMTPAGARAAKVQKLVFDSGGKTKLVEEEPRPYQPPAPAAQPSPAARRAAEPAKRPAPPPAPPARAKSADPFADMAPGQAQEGGAPPPAGTSGQPPDDPYAALLANSEEIPPLVPEDVLAATEVGHGPDFRWQAESILDPRGADEPAPVVEVPFVIYSDGGRKENYSPTGRLGNKNALQFDTGWDLDPHSGFTCIYVRFEEPDDWVTVAWQHPGHNWGEVPGGFDLSRATKLTFWAKGESGREMVEFMVGMEQGQNAVCRDSLRATTGIMRLRKEWKKYSIALDGKDQDRSRIITGFLFRIEGQGGPVVFCLDDIQFE